MAINLPYGLVEDASVSISLAEAIAADARVDDVFIAFTRQGSQVRSLHRPPIKSITCESVTPRHHLPCVSPGVIRKLFPAPRAVVLLPCGCVAQSS